jgi:hypothetical protein
VSAMKSKPRFRVGQVVAVRGQFVGVGTYFRIAAVRQGKDNWEYQQAMNNWCVEFALRPLTDDEIGPRPSKRRKP